MDKEKIGKFISQNRKEKEMTQKDLAEQLLQDLGENTSQTKEVEQR